MFNGKCVLITGGTGSFGRACAHTLLTRHKPTKVIILSRDELKQYEMAQDFAEYENIRFFLGDVRDKDRLYRAFRGVDIIIHAAALKQVPAAEYNPFEVIKTNIMGAQNIIDAAIDTQVSHVLALSTDKAAAPINLYGATKLCSDKLFIAANSYAGTGDTKFSVVRYGNVLGSRGSVIPFFREQCKSGVLTVTDPRMTRFWITLEQGVDFVLRSIPAMVGGELFVPKLPSMNIMTLAHAMCPGGKIEITGIRPGEKLHEVMVPRDEAHNTVEFENHFLIKPNFRFFNKRFDSCGARPVADDFEYNSLDNPWQLTVEKLQELIEEL
ncbi:MAG: UDP-N-acetylglucosamine 4,6-dehydratase (inverting) [Proteobacteria bacterium]|nr:UDP-N-acetylglucosamine 4,6-dehydratase (inverting) [Pseudomonadota bacterium]